MENKTISYLNSKIWYRLLKVFFTLCFLIVLAIFNIIVFSHKNNNLNTTLTEPQRQQLDGIVHQMTQNGESEHAIQFVVNDFKNKYGATYAPPTENDFRDLAARYGATYTPPPSQGQTGTLDQFQRLPPPPKGQQGFTLEQIRQQNKGGILSSIWGELKKVFKLFLAGNFIILIFFEGVRRGFYYIVLGTIRPKK